MADPVQSRPNYTVHHLASQKAVRFAVPAGFVDDSILRFRLGDSVSVTVATDALGGTLEAYAKEQEAAMRAQRFAGYSAEGLRVVDGVVCVDRSFDDGKGQVTQRQAFASGGKGVVVVVTASARPAHQAKAQQAVFAIVQSLGPAAT